VISVLIVDDHPLFRDGLAALLATVPDIDLVAAAADGGTAVRLATQHRPHVVLMDLNLPGVPGLEATRRILLAAPETAVLVLTMVDDEEAVLTAMRSGARGYVLKGAGQEEVLGAVRTVAAGGAVFGAGVAGHLLAGSGRGTAHDLTKRESDVLGLIAAGQSNPQIAHALGISVKTVQNHVSRVLTKMQVRDRTQAALRIRGL
jgi:DNA-binding NarL/FixJ family response regulator